MLEKILLTLIIKMLIIQFNAKHMSGSELNYSPLFSSFVLILVVVQLLSCIWLTLCFVTPRTAASRLPSPLQSPKFCSNSCPLSQWCHPTISFSIDPFSSCPQSSQNLAFFQWVESSRQMAKVSELQHQSFQWIFRVDFL